MIEYLIPKEAHEHKIKGKKLNLNENYDPKTEYGKRDFSYYILDHYNEMNLHPHAVLNRVLWRWYQSPSGFKPLRVF